MIRFLRALAAGLPLDKLAVGVVAGWLVAGGASCSRDHIKAIELANEGDQSVRSNVGTAISKYEQAAQLDPKNHLILSKLAKAYEKKEDWEKMASTLSRAVAIAPEFANYWYKRGYAIMQLARAGEKERFEEAKEPLQKCIEKDPNYAECYHELGEAMEFTDETQAAVENYMKAIEHDPTIGYFYWPVAQLLLTLRMYEPAEKILTEGSRAVPPLETNSEYLHTTYGMLAVVNQGKGDLQGEIAALEKAYSIGGDKHPETKFGLGSAYAKKDPPNKDKAVQLLKSFHKSICKGAKKKQFQEQCETAQTLVSTLGGSLN